MNTKPEDSSSSKPTRRLPKGPLIIILVVLASLAGAFLLTRSSPRPPPEFPPLRELPFDSPQQQDARPEPAADQAREQQ
jgi:hypothetical protein